MKKLLTILALTLISFLIIGCNTVTTSTNLTDTTTTPITTTIKKEITVSETEIDLPFRAEYQIEYELNFSLGASEVLTFISSDEEVVEVNELGKLRAVGYGTATITIKYGNEAEATVSVNVSSFYEFVAPDKRIYKLDENINLFGGQILLYDEQQNLLETKNLTSSMIVDAKLGLEGSHIIQISDEGILYSFEIYRLNEKQEKILFDDFIYVNQELHVGERIDFAVLKGNTDELLANVDNVYDYEEVNIYMLITTPGEETERISAFWYQDYNERLREITVNPNLRLEGKVNDNETDYDVFVNFDANGNPHYRLRYLPLESGNYHLTLVVEVEGEAIQTFEKSLTVDEQRDEGFKGFVRVDESNKRSFIFDNGDSYIPVGQNVAWYTSIERKHYDYKAWFEKMGDVGMNYARVWMAAWGFSPFWDDIYNFDERQTNLYSLDQTLMYAEEADIYIQLCFLHHGMFSSLVNPMWPDSENTWYVNRYGSNPYADVISDSGLFFTDSDMIANFKNQLKYIVARYGYSDHIMSFEIFNEVDWIETYNVSDGLVWHQEIANFLKEIDPNKHMVSTSLNNQSFLSNNYKVFKLDSIDFVNVHHYGIYNHTDFLPDKQYFIQNEFNKPVIYDEIGYSGNGGQDQYERDPNNITLHQGLWAGAMGGGAGTGMHWWWESWVETYDVYDEYQGIGTYVDLLDLSGEDQVLAYSEDDDLALFSKNSSSIGYMGYKYDNRVYLYVFDKSFNLANQNPPLRTGFELELTGLETGSYLFEAYDTYSGNIVFSEELNINGNQVLNFPDFSKDIALIIKKIN